MSSYPNSLYCPTHLHSYGSFDSVSRPKDIIKRACDFGMPAIALTDHGTLQASVEFYQAAKKAGVKPLLGIELYICEQDASIHTAENRACSHLVVLAKNLRGWKSLLKIVQRSNSPRNYYYKPRISLQEIAEFNGGKDLICISGHPGSVLGNALWLNSSGAFDANSYEEARACADSENWFERLDQCASLHVEVFGKENTFVEIQRMDESRLFMAQILNKALRAYAEKARMRVVATNDPHYVKKEDAELQQMLLCGRMKTTMGRVREKLANAEDVGMGGFFKSHNYYILSPDEMRPLHTEAELRATLEIADMCENYTIEEAPRCPKFPHVPENHDSASYLRELTYKGYDKLYRGKVDHSIYTSRLESELKIYHESKIDDYFLITQDILGSLKRRNKLHGTGRGSVGGSLTASCLGITIGFDPIHYGLLHERFLNEDRARRGELPDVDMDVPVEERENVIRYIKDLYGEDYVAQVATFGMYKGKSALKLVMKALDVPFALQNEITEWIPDEQKITDDLADYASEHDGAKSILMLALEDQKDKLGRYARIENGVIKGDFAEHFELAVRMEYIRSHMGKHAAAVLIGAEPLVNKLPLVKASNSSDLIAGLSWTECEWLGIPKWDVLGLACLDCLQIIAERLHKRGLL